MQIRSDVQIRQHVATTTTHALSLFDLPWQALALTLLLTLGAMVHAYPQAFAPVLRYEYGLVQAAIEWHNAPPVNTAAYLGR